MTCGCCPKIWPDGTFMRMGRSVNVCPDCVDTLIGRAELESDYVRDKRIFGHRYGDARTRFARALKTWAPHLMAEKKP